MSLRVALAAFLAVAVAVPVAAREALPPRIAQAINARIAAGEYPAVVIAVVNGRESHVYGFGQLADGRAPDGDTLFEIGSLTKTFTALLLAEQVESGHLRLDAPVSTLLPGVRMPSRNGKAITLQDLATQHSGLPRLPTNLVPSGSDPYAQYDGARLEAFLAGYRLQQDPGSAYAYSNLGFGLLGYALAARAHTGFGQLLEQRIFVPLAMRSSTAEPDDNPNNRLAKGHDESGKPAAAWHFDALAGAGAINSSGNDMLRYLEANMGRLPSPLGAAIALTHTPRADTPQPGERIGLAWMVRSAGDRAMIWHNGMTGGYASFMGFTADRQHGVVVMTNIAQSVDDLGMAVLLPEAQLRPARTTIAVAAKDLDAYVGSYRLAPGFVLNVFREGDQLYGQATGQGAFPLFASATDEFFAKAVELRVSFQREDGKIAGLVLHQNGDHPAPRLGSGQDAGDGNPPVVPLDRSVLAAYVGRYRLAPNAEFTITLADTQLMAQLTGQAAFPVYPSARDHFFYRVVPAQLEFERDGTGKVQALVLHQNGMAQRAARIGP